MKDLLYAIPDLDTMSVDELKSLLKEINLAIDKKERQKYEEDFKRVFQAIDYMSENYGSHTAFCDSYEDPITWRDLREFIHYHNSYCC